VLFYVKDVLPPMTQVVGITTVDFAKENPDKVRAIIAGRRKGVDFIYANPKEAAAILSRTYERLPRAVAESAVANMVAVKYWSRGDFDLAGMNEFVRGLQLVGEWQGAVDWGKVLDRSFLPPDLKGSS
jgi:NitT/TauT family transport system substrate-binding protein